ncbi:MAG: TIM barrel protein [Sulfolobales archaeon]
MKRYFDRLLFGTAGIPLSTPKKTSQAGIVRVRELGLDAMELEFVRGVKMSLETAAEVKRVAEENNIVLTVHAPYYINLNSDDPAKVRDSIERILQSARVGFAAGAFSVVFHAGYYGGDTPGKAYARIRESIKQISSTLRNESVDIWLRPETMGGLAEFGDIEEVISLSEEIEGVLPAIDFAHIHARSIGRYNSYEEIVSLLELVERRLGREALKTAHIHMSGIEYGRRGEVKHLNLEESDLNYRDILRALRDFKVSGVVISESPNIEEDAILMKKTYESL